MSLAKNDENGVPGLILIENFITEQEEGCLVDSTDKGTWSGLGVG
jgi:hypothetical protein